MGVPSLAVALIALNEERGLPLALASVRDIADELVVAVDSRTTDRTREVAAGARLVEVEFSDFAQIRNAALDAVTADWVLFLDADETLEGDPRPLLDRPAIWEFPRHHWCDLERTRPAADDRDYPDRQARLFPNDGSVRFFRPVHEVARGRRRRRAKDVCLHHFKEALRDAELLADRARLYDDLVRRGLEGGHRFRRGKDYE